MSILKMPISISLLHIAAPFAVYQWVNGERRAVDDVRDIRKPLQDVFLNWLRVWRVGRGMSEPTCMELARELDGCRHYLLTLDHNQDLKALPTWVEGHRKQLMLDINDINRQETSLLSKFVFSLRPDIGVPIDKYVREGIRLYDGGQEIERHEYVNYFYRFNQFFQEFDQALTNTVLVDTARNFWQDPPYSMEMPIFRRRAADKYLWMLGKTQFNQE
ncbi:MAG: hypothetical protein OXF73_07020 [Gammaproteobacteria bacterium]|nr:hypothetical protein [Gammaproteobacteria bacterium]